MLSAGSSSCLPPVSVSVYGTGPGFLLLLFSCRSSGRETVNTHSTAPTHKSEQRAALYIQISHAERGKVRKKKGGEMRNKSKVRQRHGDTSMNMPTGHVGCPPLPSVCAQIITKCIGFSLGNEMKPQISIAFWRAFLSPSPLLVDSFPPLPFYFQHLWSFQGNSPPVIASQLQGLRINNIVITHFTNFQEEILPQQMRAALIFAKW